MLGANDTHPTHDAASRGGEARMMALTGARYGPMDDGRLAHIWPLLYLIFLPDLGVPIAALFHTHPASSRLMLVLAGLTIFVAFYLWAGWQNDLSRASYPAPSPRKSGIRYWGPVAVLAGLSVALVLGDGPRWLNLLIFTSAGAGGRFSLSQSLRVVAGLALLTALLGWLTHDSFSDFGQASFWTAMAGILTIIMNHFRRTNRALRVAREEIARLAVDAERLRFARDLHDLLGHDLARIALQSELAEALAPTALDQAIAAMRDVGSVARTALREVRAAVAGYRQPTLGSELRGAGEILAAAGITYHCEGERFPAPPAVEAALAWAVREGVTNVVKHSRAQHCTIRLNRSDGEVSVEVIDDGSGPAANAASVSGSGLVGLGERAAALGGRCEARQLLEGGFLLAVVLPIESSFNDAPMHGDQPTVSAGAGVGSRA